MKRTSVCTIINLILVAVLWLLIVSLPNLLAGHVLAWWINLPLGLFGLLAAGYFVQYVVTPVVNRKVMGTKAGKETNQP